MKVNLSIIILNYNTKKLLENLLVSINQSYIGNFLVEIIVVDNKSWDGSTTMIKDKFKTVRLISNKENLGFSKGMNQGIKVAKGKYLLFLNSDTLFCEKNVIYKMINFMENNKKYAASTCMIKLENGKLDPACHRGFPTPWAAFTYLLGLEKLFPRSRIFGQYHQGWKNMNNIHEVDAISGAFFMMRKSALEKVGQFDEDFFMYGEDLDLCYRLHLANLKIYYNPETYVIHYKKQSGRKKKETSGTEHILIREKTRNYFFDTMRLFYEKHYKNKYPPLVYYLVRIGISLLNKIKD